MTDTFDAYRRAHHAHQAATTHAQAASARYTTERTRDAYEAMGAAWQAADRAMRVMFEARAAMCDVVLAGGQLWLDKHPQYAERVQTGLPLDAA